MNLWLKIRIWTKIIFFGLIALYVVLFTVFNLGEKTTLWLYPGGEVPTSVLLLAAGAFLFGVVSTLLTRTILRTVHQMREMKRRRLEKEAAAVVARAAKLRVRDEPTTPSQA